MVGVALNVNRGAWDESKRNLGVHTVLKIDRVGHVYTTGLFLEHVRLGFNSMLQQFGTVIVGFGQVQGFESVFQSQVTLQLSAQHQGPSIGHTLLVVLATLVAPPVISCYTRDSMLFFFQKSDTFWSEAAT